MRHALLWTMVVLALPGAAVADGAIGPGAEDGQAAAQPGLERPASPGSGSALDLQLDPKQLPSPHARSGGAQAIEAAGDRPAAGVALDTAERGLSFGVEVKPRSRVGSLAREDNAADESGLERLIDRATLGVRGRYRF